MTTGEKTLLVACARYFEREPTDILASAGLDAWDTAVSRCGDWRSPVPDEIAEAWDSMPISARIVAFWMGSIVAGREDID